MRTKTKLVSDEKTINISKTNGQVKAKSLNVPWPKVFLVVAVISTVIGAFVATKTLAQTEKKIAEVKEMARPANVTLTKIAVENCADCFNVDDAIATFKKQNVSVSEEKTFLSTSAEAKTLITDLGIKRLPTYVVKGEITKQSLEGFVKGNGEVKNDTFIFTGVSPLFVDPLSNKEMGKVSVTYLTDPSCSSCINPKLTIDAYKKAGVKVTEEKEVSWNSLEGQKIINQYKIEKLPTFVLSSDVSYYSSIKDNWQKIGTVEPDGAYVARQLFLPYRDVTKGQIVGLVDVVYLTDSSCTDCYKPQEVHKNILTQGFGVGIRSEQSVDANSPYGKSLVSKYKITQVPTLLISPEVAEYSGIKQVWPQVGTTEPDGWYVFRQVSRLGSVIYKDFTSNQVVRPQQQQAAP
ncbi:hypothetical protein HY384_02045 [Candidatus Daviesbacteria bacterium]|nr:hypothetical protein [Candidatus Daviesbacteria bacterium]